MPGTELIDAPPSSRAPDLLAGKDYQIISLLGKGGMGEVYLAQHRRLGHLVAIKALRSSFHASEQLLERMRVEGEFGARFRHKNLVAVFDASTLSDGRPYIAMEYLKGISLHDKLVESHGGPLPLLESLDLAAQILDGLEVIHGAGLVHRDIKPGNLFVTEGAVLKILDLGLAKVLQLASEATPSPLGVPTSTGAILGSVRYMAPEQARGGDIDPRADLYAVGLVLYRMLCGRGPFDYARGFEAALMAHVTDPPPPPSQHLRAPLPGNLDAIILRCLEKDPCDRFESAADLARALRTEAAHIRERQGVGVSFVTAPMEAPTTMIDPELGRAIVPERAAAGVSLRVFIMAMIVAVAVGLAVGGIVVALRMSS